MKARISESDQTLTASIVVVTCFVGCGLDLGRAYWEISQAPVTARAICHNFICIFLDCHFVSFDYYL
jgi:hypothetical protein